MSFGKFRVPVTEAAAVAPGMYPEARVAAGDSTCFYKAICTGTDEVIHQKMCPLQWGCSNRRHRSSRFSKVLNHE